MSIRKALIEAGADRIWNDLPRYELMYPECERIARYVLDTFLDYLTANRAEWQRAADMDGVLSYSVDVQELLATLKGGDEDAA